MKTEDYVVLIIKFLPYFPYLSYKLFFFLLCIGKLSWLSSHVSRCLCPAHPQTYRHTERTGRVGTGRDERIVALVDTLTRRTLQAVEPLLLDSSPSLASDEFGNTKRAKPKRVFLSYIVSMKFVT